MNSSDSAATSVAPTSISGLRAIRCRVYHQPHRGHARTNYCRMPEHHCNLPLTRASTRGSLPRHENCCQGVVFMNAGRTRGAADSAAWADQRGLDISRAAVWYVEVTIPTDLDDTRLEINIYSDEW